MNDYIYKIILKQWITYINKGYKIELQFNKKQPELIVIKMNPSNNDIIKTDQYFDTSWKNIFEKNFKKDIMRSNKMMFSKEIQIYLNRLD